MKNTIHLKADSVKANPKPKSQILRYLIVKKLPFLENIIGRPVHAVATLRDQFGNIKQVEHYYNTVTTSGKNGTADQLLLTPSLAKPTHMAVGTGTPAANALGVELDRNAFTTKTRAANNVVTSVGDWAAGDATGAITEAGWFDAAAAGNMWLSASFAVINKGALDTLNISWTYTIA